VLFVVGDSWAAALAKLGSQVGKPLSRRMAPESEFRIRLPVEPESRLKNTRRRGILALAAAAYEVDPLSVRKRSGVS